MHINTTEINLTEDLPTTRNKKKAQNTILLDASNEALTLNKSQEGRFWLEIDLTSSQKTSET